jgi:hypothetical protein
VCAAQLSWSLRGADVGIAGSEGRTLPRDSHARMNPENTAIEAFYLTTRLKESGKTPYHRG